MCEKPEKAEHIKSKYEAAETFVDYFERPNFFPSSFVSATDDIAPLVFIKFSIQLKNIHHGLPPILS